MILLVLGVLLWAGAHFFKRLMPDARAKMGDAGKGAVTVALVISIVLMVIGYRSAEVIDLWIAPGWMVHVNNFLVLVAIFMMSPAPKKGKTLNGMRHPMLAGFRAWAFAHILVNGDVASLILFGGLFVWALLEVVIINKSEPEWTPGPAGSYAKDGMFLVASLVLMAVIGYIHYWVGPWPYPV
ncbi:putative membrane protein [Shimia thalassica]|uniref:Putative membrane protein n=1 Tax=Shimia thalassica TaxID=1715693 RepID=A0A0P1ICX1_9RHOB|nr:NnrU family protein [Shimia thalassica]CUK05932.1 putative membrane protein [Shimia thalassica]